MGAVTRWSCLTKAGVSSSKRRIGVVVSTGVLGTLTLAAPAAAFTETFNFTGAAQTWTVPRGISEATFDLYGAPGGGGGGRFTPGLGGRATATIPVITGASIQVNVGGRGTNGAGGFNGGGTPSGSANVRMGGGGASDIRVGGTALEDRALVAGGGGGAGSGSFVPGSAAGGNGGGLSGLAGMNGGCSDAQGGGGGTQTMGGSAPAATPGSFGVGGNPSTDGNLSGGGGGGGWYGGGGGAVVCDGGAASGGGGGSGYGPDGTVFQTGVRGGDGLATVTYTVTTPTLIGSVVDLNLPAGLEAALLKPLVTAQQNLDAGKVRAACNQLNAFILRVAGQSGKAIPTAAADRLSGQAEDMRGTLSCRTRISCGGEAATIAGTDGADRLRGTSGDDVIAAGGGNDRVVGLGGDDVVCGGAGADLLRGQGGDDALRGGSGKDELRGGSGSNRCRSGKGSDSRHHC